MTAARAKMPIAIPMPAVVERDDEDEVEGRGEERGWEERMALSMVSGTTDVVDGAISGSAEAREMVFERAV
jgi:hypothetical protein